MIKKDATCRELFGGIVTLDELKMVYKTLAITYHPDTGGTAEDFKLLQEYYELAQREIEDGTYNDKWPLGKFTEITTKKATYKVGRVVHRGRISDLHIAETNGEKCVAKIALDEKVNGMLQNEVSVLKELHDDETFLPYFPKVIDSFLVGKRRVTIFQSLLDRYSLEEIMREYPEGVGGRHFAWMFNRALEVLGYIHSKGYVHGAISPRHLLYKVDNHGLALTDFCFATKIGEPMTYVPDRKYAYPQEVLDKKGVYPGTDLYLLGNAFLPMTDSLPTPLKGFINSSRISTLTYRPSNAWDMRVRMTETLKQLYGNPEFIPFTMKEK